MLSRSNVQKSTEQAKVLNGKANHVLLMTESATYMHTVYTHKMVISDYLGLCAVFCIQFRGNANNYATFPETITLLRNLQG